MTRRPVPTVKQQVFSIPANKTGAKKIKIPFWLPASNFYILAIFTAVSAFLLLWGIFHDGDEPMPWIPAAVGGGFILLGGVFLREIILRKARLRFLAAQQRLDYNLNNAKIRNFQSSTQRKLSIQQNAKIIADIQKKSDAAKVLIRLPEGHYEVFEICCTYLKINEAELKTVGSGSPRLAALRRGREIVENLQRFHLLTWAEIESRRITQEASNCVSMAEKIETAQKANHVINAALEFYPDEIRLTESRQAIDYLISSMRIGHWIEQAERANFKGNYKRALSHYKDALFFMARENGKIEEADKVAEQINREIDILKRKISEKKTAPKITRKND